MYLPIDFIRLISYVAQQTSYLRNFNRNEYCVRMKNEQKKKTFVGRFSVRTGLQFMLSPSFHWIEMNDFLNT